MPSNRYINIADLFDLSGSERDIVLYLVRNGPSTLSVLVQSTGLQRSDIRQKAHPSREKGPHSGLAGRKVRGRPRAGRKSHRTARSSPEGPVCIRKALLRAGQHHPACSNSYPAVFPLPPGRICRSRPASHTEKQILRKASWLR